MRGSLSSIMEFFNSNFLRFFTVASFLSAHRVTVMVIGSGLGYPSSKPEQGCLDFI